MKSIKYNGAVIHFDRHESVHIEEQHFHNVTLYQGDSKVASIMVYNEDMENLEKYFNKKEDQQG